MTAFATRLNRSWVRLLAALVPVLLTYPVFEPDYGAGLDSSYVWGLNHLLSHDYGTLTTLLYPYGPLAMLKMPTFEGGHFALFLLFYTVVKWALVALMLEVVHRRGGNALWALLLALPMCVLGNIDTYVVGAVALMVLLLLTGGAWWLYAAAALLSALALWVKLSFGLQCGAVLVVGLAVHTVRRRSAGRSALMAAIAVLAYAAVGWAVYGSVPKMAGAVAAMPHLLGGYAAALVLEPPHHLWCLLLFAVLAAAYPALCGDRWSRCLYLLLALPLWANWKHGIVREDYFHFRQLLYFAVCMFTLLPAVQRRWHLLPWVASVVLVVALWGNLLALPGGRLSTASPVNVVTQVAGYRHVLQCSRLATNAALEPLALPQSTLDIIGNGTVDCYPWEQVYCAANHLRWQPHATLELGAGNSDWLNRQAALNFERPEAVDYVLLHRTVPGRDDGLRTLDGRYLLSDEPAVIEAIMANYTPVDSGAYGLLLARRPEPLKPTLTLMGSYDLKQGQWLPLPPVGDSVVLRLMVGCNLSLAGSLRSALYKPDVCTIELLLPDSTVATYRYSPATSRGGLWVSPLPVNMQQLADFMTGDSAAVRPLAIRLIYTHPTCHAATAAVQLQALVRTSIPQTPKYEL